MENYKQACVDALKAFIEEASNENKMELMIIYDEEEAEDQKTSLLGTALKTALDRILVENDHPDEYLLELKAQFY